MKTVIITIGILLLSLKSCYSQLNLTYDENQPIKINNVDFSEYRTLYQNENLLNTFFPNENFTIDKDFEYANSISYHTSEIIINFTGISDNKYDISRIKCKKNNSYLLINNLIFEVGNDIRSVISVNQNSISNGNLVFENGSDEYFYVKYDLQSFIIEEIGFSG